MIGEIEVFAVVAMARNRVIGDRGGMPWRLPGDLRRFRELTTGRPMIMGRRTLDSIGRLLPDRDTIVLTRGDSLNFAGAVLAKTPEEALQRAADAARARGTNGIAVVGGAEIYTLLMPAIDRIYLTRIDAEPSGDTRLQPFEHSFELTEQTPLVMGERDSAAYRAETWDRLSGSV